MQLVGATCFVVLICAVSPTAEGRSGNSGSTSKVGPILVARVQLTVTTSVPRRSVFWLSGHPVPPCFLVSCSTSSMNGWVNAAASCAGGTGKSVRFTKMAVGMECSDDEFRIWEDERCIDTSVFQNRYFWQEFVFACSHLPATAATYQLRNPDTNRLVRLENSRQVQSGSAACCRDSESGCARDLTEAFPGILSLTSSPLVPEKCKPFVSRQQVSLVITVARVVGI